MASHGGDSSDGTYKSGEGSDGRDSMSKPSRNENMACQIMIVRPADGEVDRAAEISLKPVLDALNSPHYRMKPEHLMAGVTGGVVATMILHPLDTIRTRLAARQPTKIGRPQYGGMIDGARSIVRHDGLRGLYRGVTLGIITAGCTWGPYFFFYDVIKVAMQQGDPSVSLGPTKQMAAAAASGTLTLTLTNPIWVVKTRLCLQFGANVQMLDEHRRYRGISDAFAKTYQYEGLRGLYRGYIPGAVGVIKGAIQFMVYEEMKERINRSQDKPIDARLSTLTYLSLAACSKLLAATITYPYQLMRTRLQDHYHEYSGLRDVIGQTWRHEGFRGFYKGLVAALTRVTPATAITFVVYENVSRYLIQQKSQRTAAPLSPTVLT